MATRPPRLRRPHTYFHVTSRGTNRWNIFLDDLDRQRFMHILASVCKRYEIDAHAYCLMGNHFHLVLYCPTPCLSSAMRDLKSRYGTYYNKRHHATGGVFEAPSVEVPVLTDEQLCVVVRYVHRNPLDLDPSACLASYQWSSHAIYLGQRVEPDFMCTSIGLELFGPDYRTTVEAPRTSDKVHNERLSIVRTPGVLTIEDRPTMSLAEILRSVARHATCDLVDLRAGDRTGLLGVAVLVASNVGGYSAAEIAEPFGFRSTSAVYMARRRARERSGTNAGLDGVYAAVVSEFQRAA